MPRIAFAGLTISEAIRNQHAQKPMSWIAVFSARGPSMCSPRRNPTHRPGSNSNANTTARSGCSRPFLSVQGAQAARGRERSHRARRRGGAR